MSFSDKFQSFAASLKALLPDLPAADQFGPEDVKHRALKGAANLGAQCESLLTEMDAAFAEAKNTGMGEGKQAALAEMAATHIAKADHESALQGAAAEGIRQGRLAAENDFSAKLSASAERTRLVSEHKLPQPMADKVGDEALAPASAEATRRKLTERAKELTDIGCNPDEHKEDFAAAAEDLTEAGDKNFAAKMGHIRRGHDLAKKLVRAGASAEANGRPRVNPIAASSGGGGKAPEKEKAPLFL